jgi:hypothetical protein
VLLIGMVVLDSGVKLKQTSDEMRQVGDGSVLTVAVMALESASPGVFAGRLEISCSGRVLVSVFADPRADDAVRTCTKAR